MMGEPSMESELVIAMLIGALVALVLVMGIFVL